MKFEWDNLKNQANIKKHGITFEIAKKVFYDDNAIIFDDPDHFEDEQRFLIIGLIKDTGIFVVSHCYRKNDDVIRIISAREATVKEKRAYYNIGKR